MTAKQYSVGSFGAVSESDRNSAIVFYMRLVQVLCHVIDLTVMNVLVPLGGHTYICLFFIFSFLCTLCIILIGFSLLFMCFGFFLQYQ